MLGKESIIQSPVDLSTSCRSPDILRPKFAHRTAKYNKSTVLEIKKRHTCGIILAVIKSKLVKKNFHIWSVNYDLPVIFSLVNFMRSFEQLML